jgi:hypothetical protein
MLASRPNISSRTKECGERRDLAVTPVHLIGIRKGALIAEDRRVEVRESIERSYAQACTCW